MYEGFISIFLIGYRIRFIYIYLLSIYLQYCVHKNAVNMKKLWNMKVTILPIVFGAFSSVTKGLLKGLEDLEVGSRVDTIQTT